MRIYIYRQKYSLQLGSRICRTFQVARAYYYKIRHVILLGGIFSRSSSLLHIISSFSHRMCVCTDVRCLQLHLLLLRPLCNVYVDEQQNCDDTHYGT